ncbi:MAG: hypothetical protein JWP78_3920 [Mucilaginibacter sp.]|nr:hypothetical protein [Mucilaginibacter sp.]
MCGYAKIIRSKDSKINKKLVSLSFKKPQSLSTHKDVIDILVVNKL